MSSRAAQGGGRRGAGARGGRKKKKKKKKEGPDSLELLEQRLKHIRWKRMQNEIKHKQLLHSTKNLQELDVVSELAANRVEEKVAWMKNVIDDELHQPLIIPQKPPDLYDLEMEQRKEIVRFDKHMRVVEHMANKLRANNPEAVDEAFSMSKRELLRECGMDVLNTARSGASYDADEDRDTLGDYLAVAGATMANHDLRAGEGILTDDPEERDDIVPAVTRLALLHRELEEERRKNVEAVDELIEFQRSEFNLRR